MSDHIQVRAAGTGQWELLADSTTQDSPHGRTLTIPIDSPLAARLTGTGITKWFVIIGDFDSPKGHTPDLWRGIIRSWRPAGDRLLIDVRPSSVTEHTYG